ncbi:hypothetical protein EIP91_004022 [Steccherinum ochraceum]|uniref:Uncharacterized protein n=1 Tax=Steccherinum ochraceum TaxID=92696 RepID=A0A4R0RQ22_9APHY|nr:hypothetical protein EIP91_004022 [Steccherinum ochraceum]
MVVGGTRQMQDASSSGCTPGPSNFQDLLSSPVSTAQHRQDARQSIDSAIASCLEAIAGYQTTLRKLSAKRNLCADISILPDEVLGEIMWFSIPTGSDDGSRRGSLAVLPLSHVSRHWRDVAMSYPKLWTYITMSCVATEEQLDTLLHRAKSYPLCLTVSWTHMRTSRLRRLRAGWINLLRRSPRVQALTFRPDVDDDFRIFPYVLNNFSSSRHTVSLLDLRYLVLELEAYREELPDLAFPNLIGFKLSTSADPSVITTHWLMQTICAMPALKELALAGTFLPSTVSSEDDQYEPVPLPHLTKFTISGRMAHLKWILEHITIPPSADIELSCLSQNSRRWRGHTAVAAHLSRLLHERMAGEPTSVHHQADAGIDFVGHVAAVCINVDLDDEDNLTYRLVLMPRPARASSASRDPKLHCGRIDLNLQSNRRQHVEDVWDALPLENIHSLLLFEGTASDDVWKLHLRQGFVARALDRMRGVRSFATQWSPQLLKDLLLPEERADQPLFPQMHFLALLSGVRTQMPASAPVLKQVLTELEAERELLGGVLLVGNDVPEDAVESLKSQVLRTNVNWTI